MSCGSATEEYDNVNKQQQIGYADDESDEDAYNLRFEAVFEQFDTEDNETNCFQVAETQQSAYLNVNEDDDCVNNMNEEDEDSQSMCDNNALINNSDDVELLAYDSPAAAETVSLLLPNCNEADDRFGGDNFSEFNLCLNQMLSDEDDDDNATKINKSQMPLWNSSHHCATPQIDDILNIVQLQDDLDLDLRDMVNASESSTPPLPLINQVRNDSNSLLLSEVATNEEQQEEEDELIENKCNTLIAASTISNSSTALESSSLPLDSTAAAAAAANTTQTSGMEMVIINRNSHNCVNIFQ